MCGCRSALGPLLAYRGRLPISFSHLAFLRFSPPRRSPHDPLASRALPLPAALRRCLARRRLTPRLLLALPPSIQLAAPAPFQTPPSPPRSSPAWPPFFSPSFSPSPPAARRCRPSEVLHAPLPMFRLPEPTSRTVDRADTAILAAPARRLHTAASPRIGFFVTIWITSIMFKSNDILRKQTAFKALSQRCQDCCLHYRSAIGRPMRILNLYALS